ncbi:MAG: hypothetical protein KY434_02620 [Actinobacteria bacterium]|nr:hypothetical protein [Actinomycetota bacterium]
MGVVAAPPRLPEKGGEVAWLASLLCREPARPIVGAARPAGQRVLDEFVVLPAQGRPRYLVPPGRRAASAALRGYNRLRRPHVRAARAVLAAGLRPGLLQRLSGLRVALCVPHDASPGSAEAATLPGALRKMLQAPELVVAAGLGGAEPNRKPVLQLLDPQGGIRGFAKVGWNDYTRTHVENEVAALERLTAEPPRCFGTPSLVAAGRWHGLRVCVSSPLPPEVRPYAAATGPPPLSVTREIAGRGEPERGALAASRYWRQLRGRLAAAPLDGRRRRVVDACMHDLADRAGAVQMGFGAWHGDWSPWNMGWVGSRLHVWDWEHSAPCVPLGFDLLHFDFQVAFELRGRRLDQAVSRVAARGPDQLARLGVTADARPPTVMLYLLELLCRSDEGMRAGVGRDARFYPSVLDALEALSRTGPSARSWGRSGM